MERKSKADGNSGEEGCNLASYSLLLDVTSWITKNSTFLIMRQVFVCVTGSCAPVFSQVYSPVSDEHLCNLACILPIKVAGGEEVSFLRPIESGRGQEPHLAQCLAPRC